MFDYAAPKKFNSKIGQPRGVGQHPHRGFETVTIAFEGEVEHHDSTGKTGIIEPGDVQWMTAGRGIIHQEYHSKKFTQEGGMFGMFWHLCCIIIFTRDFFINFFFLLMLLLM